MRKANKYEIIGALTGIAGFAMIGFSSNWFVAIGVFICFFANNLEQRGKRQ